MSQKAKNLNEVFGEEEKNKTKLPEAENANVEDDMDDEIDPSLPVEKTVSTKKVFGEQQAKKTSKVVEIDEDSLAKILQRLNQLEGVVGNAEEPVSLLKEDKKGMDIRISFYTDPDTGRDYVLTGMEGYKLPNGTVVSSKTMSVRDEILGKNVMEQFVKVVLTDMETNKTIVKEVMQKSFKGTISQSYVTVSSVDEKIVDLTPSNESVNYATYEESPLDKRYIVRNVSDKRVKLEVQGKSRHFTVKYNDKEYVLPESVVNYVID